MKSKIIANISKLFLLGKKRRAVKQEAVQPESEKELIDALNLPEDNPWYFAGEKAKEANFLTKLHFATGPRLMGGTGTRSRWAWNSTEQKYRPEAGGPVGSVEVWNDQYHLGTEAGVPIEMREMQKMAEQESQLKNSKLAQAYYAVAADPMNGLLTQELPVEVETMEIPTAMAEDQQPPPPAAL